MLLCLIEAYAALAEFGGRLAESFETAYFWMKASAAWPFLIPIPLHFILVLTEQSKLLKSKLTYLLLYPMRQSG